MDTLVADRLHTQSRLPSYRGADLLKSPMHHLLAGHGLHTDENHKSASDSSTRPDDASVQAGFERPQTHKKELPAPPEAGGATTTLAFSHEEAASPAVAVSPSAQPEPAPEPQPAPAPAKAPAKAPAPARNPQAQTHAKAPQQSAAQTPNDPTQNNADVPSTRKARNPSPHSRNGVEGRAMQRPYKTENSSTTDWVAQQSIARSPTTTANSHSPTAPAPPKSRRSVPATPTTARPIIKPIRGFKPSSRKSLEMAARRASLDPDSTIRAHGGNAYGNNSSRMQHRQPEEQHSDDSDLFLRAARDEELARHAPNSRDTLDRSDSRRSRGSERPSHPPSSTQLHSVSRRRGSQQESSNETFPMEAPQESVAQALTYRPSRDRPPALEDLNRSRYINSRSNPTTPRTRASREMSPESPGTYSGRRPSVPDSSLPSRAYRQSNLSYTTPRVYNSSPLVSRPTDSYDAPETHRAAEGTNSTVSTTAPSTVWDELEELKSRINRLELTGKLPPTSGAAISRASNERPPTATTTDTTMSSSPKRGSGNSLSPPEPVALNPAPVETHPLLRAALAKSRPLLNDETYKALEATTCDALMIATMMGTSGQPGPISSSQSTVGGPAAVSDRQVRRKVDSLCRSLTELCLALSEGKHEPTAPAVKENTPQPSIREMDIRPSIELNEVQRQNTSTELVKAKASPRALSRLETRRSNLLAGGSLLSPRYGSSEAATPTQTSMGGRRTSLLLRTRRAVTEEQDEEEHSRFRAPSRANTEIGRLRNSPREYASHQPLPERAPPAQSALPVRRHFASTSLNNNNPLPTPPISMLGGRRYLDRLTPDRDASSTIGRDDRAQRKGSVGSNLPLVRNGSITRNRPRHSSVVEH